MAHGNIKSSNIFVNSEQYGCVSDFGLADIMRRPGKWVVVRHQYSSEYTLKNASQESDVYSFGVVLLQLLTGKLEIEPQGGLRRNVHIIEWALSMRSEDWGSKLIDQSLWSSEFSYQTPPQLLDMLEFEQLELERKIRAEMVEMLQLARRCLAMLRKDRPKMFEVVFHLENINKSRSRITSKLNCCLPRD